jgi:hypothetical protein
MWGGELGNGSFKGLLLLLFLLLVWLLGAAAPLTPLPIAHTPWKNPGYVAESDAP